MRSYGAAGTAIIDAPTADPAIVRPGVGSAAGSLALVLFCNGSSCSAEPTAEPTAERASEPLLVAAGDGAAAFDVVAALAGFVALDLAALDPIAPVAALAVGAAAGSCPWFFAIIVRCWLNQLVS